VHASDIIGELSVMTARKTTQREEGDCTVGAQLAKDEVFILVDDVSLFLGSELSPRC